MKSFSKVFVFFFVFLVLLPQAWGLSFKEIKKAYYESYAFERRGEYTKAIKAMMPVYASYPKSYTVNLRLGWLYYLNKNFANSIKHYETALKVAPYSVEAMLGLSLPLMAQEKWHEVEELMYRILKEDYYNYYGNLRLAIALIHQRKFKDASRIAKKMLYLYPTDVNFLNVLGEASFYQGKKDYARSIFNSVLVLSPKNRIALKFLSFLNHQK